MKKIGKGKVREIYQIDDQQLFIVVTDRISAYDFIMPTTIPDKGVLLNKLSVFWSGFLKDVIADHVVTANFEAFPAVCKKEEFRGRSLVVKKLKMLPVECIVRGYITGSGWAEYQKKGEICGLKIPAGMKESEQFSKPLFTPTTKAELGDHDENISFEEACGLVGNDMAEKLRETSIAVYQKCADYARARGIIIADTKFEFGLDERGELVLADEVLTPDSSRFWPVDQYKIGRGQESFDKQYLRNWLSDHGYRDRAPEHLPQDVVERTRAKYIEAYEKLTGERFE